MDYNMQIRMLLLCKEYMDEEDTFWDLMACIIGCISKYYLNHIYKVPCMTSYFTGQRWMIELLNGHETRCFNDLRMYPPLFMQLCTDLETRYGLRPSYRMSIIEKVGIFIYVLAHGAPNKITRERFQHSGETVSRVFKEVLYVMDGMSRDILVPRDRDFKEVPQKLANDARYMPYFKDCIGGIDGTHISIIVPEEDQIRYRGRKGIPTTNVLAVCDFDLLFTYVLTGWEGSAHDSRIFLDTIGDPRLKFPKPPEGKYYVVDKGYPERKGYLTPYPKTRYHLSEYRGANPRGIKEVFNRAHSSLRSCIERSFGVLKARWKILDKVPMYSFKDQNRIICSCFALHNYIRRSSIGDPAFRLVDRDPNFIPPEGIEDVETSVPPCVQESSTREMTTVRDNIAACLLEARRLRRLRRVH
ncbi:uncharacterized protein [Spinacia oleracea]|nr:uncharacterized protein LOC130470328 isoform X2 [Spinacia oleracea]